MDTEAITEDLNENHSAADWEWAGTTREEITELQDDISADIGLLSALELAAGTPVAAVAETARRTLISTAFAHGVKQGLHLAATQDPPPAPDDEGGVEELGPERSRPEVRERPADVGGGCELVYGGVPVVGVSRESTAVDMARETGPMTPDEADEYWRREGLTTHRRAVELDPSLRELLLP